MSTAELEKRLIAVEQEVARLRSERLNAGGAHPIQSLEAIHNTFEDDDAFREAARLGRKWRASQRLNGRSSKAKRK